MRHRRRPTDPSLRVLLGYALLAVLHSAWVCGTLSTVDVRFMARTAWILPFVVIMVGWRNRTTAT